MVVADTVVGVGEFKLEGSNVEVQLQATILKVHAKFGVWPVGEPKLCQGSWFYLYPCVFSPMCFFFVLGFTLRSGVLCLYVPGRQKKAEPSSQKSEYLLLSDLSAVLTFVEQYFSECKVVDGQHQLQEGMRGLTLDESPEADWVECDGRLLTLLQSISSRLDSLESRMASLEDQVTTPP